MKQLLFLLLFPCLALAQYQGNGNQKISLGEQTTADGLVFRGVANDTNVITPFSDTSAYIILDTVNSKFYHYNRTTTFWSLAGGGGDSGGVSSFSAGTTGLTPSTATTGAVTLGGTLAVANGGTGATSFSPNNYLIRTNSSGVFDTSAVYEAGGKVGIGTTTPTEKLHVVGNGLFTGNIGAGIDVAQARLHVKGSGTTSSTSALKVDNSGGTNLLNILDNGAATFRNISNSGAPATIGTTVNATLSIDNVNSVMTNIGNLSASPYSVWLQVQDKTNLATTYPLSLQPNGGNVGIGTTSPSAILDVVGANTTDKLTLSTYTTGATGSNVRLRHARGTVASPTKIINADDLGQFIFQGYDGENFLNGAQIQSGVDAVVSKDVMPGFISFLTNQGNERMRITSGGNVGIGTTSPAVQFHTTSNVRFAGLASITDLRTDADGDLFNGSDFNLKNTIDTINFGLSDVLKLKPVSFNWNDEARNINEYKSMGFIAQDIMDVIPNAASTMGDGDMQVDYNAIVATLTKAIQEQQALIKALEQRILILENK